MLIVRPDHSRRIDLPGAGPCPRPVDVDGAKAGFASLVALRVYSFAEGVVIDGEAEDDEVFIVALRGAAEIAVSAESETAVYSLRADGGSRAAYLPPQGHYRLTAFSDCDIAYARSHPKASSPSRPCDFAAFEGELKIPDHASGMGLTLRTVEAGETSPVPGADASSVERFVHVRLGADGVASVDGAPLANLDSAALAEGEAGILAVERGTVEVLAIAASRRSDGQSKGTIDGRS